MQNPADSSSCAHHPTGPAASTFSPGPKKLEFVPESPIETANRLLKDHIRTARDGSGGSTRELLDELLTGANLADSEENIALFKSVLDDVLREKVTTFAGLGKRIRGLILVSDRVRAAVMTAEAEALGVTTPSTEKGRNRNHRTF